jgi:hypothetical protein
MARLVQYAGQRIVSQLLDSLLMASSTGSQSTVTSCNDSLCPRRKLHLPNLLMMSLPYNPGAKSSIIQYVRSLPSDSSSVLIPYVALDLFKEIETMEHFGDYGNKIETLIRHLLYLQLKEPENKSIVFSAWADSLHSTFLTPFSPLPV